MGIKRRKYPGEFKIEMVEEVLSGHSTLEFARLNDLNPNLIIRWKRQWLDGKFHGTSANDTELRKLKLTSESVNLLCSWIII